MAEAGNMSVSRCMGDWLSDTSDAALMITIKMEDAKSAPMKVLRDMQEILLGLGETVIQKGLSEEYPQARERTARPTGRTERLSGAAGTVGYAPSSNTGLNSPLNPK
jgi:hypothetical protein